MSVADAPVSEKVGWVDSQITGLVDENGNIALESTDHTLMYTHKPQTVAESGITPDDWGRLTSRTPGPINTKTHLGGALAIIVPASALLIYDNEKFDNRLKEIIGCELPEFVHIAGVRNIGAPTSRLVLEAFGGMATSTKFLLEQLLEGIGECLVYRKDGYARIMLPNSLSEYQSAVDKELANIWEIVNPGFPCQYKVPIRILNIGSDKLDGRPGILSCGPVGDLGLLSIAQIDLPNDATWMFRDGELSGEKPLNRILACIFPREGRSPIAFQMELEGGISKKGPAMPISGDAVKETISHLLQKSLGPRGLDWL